MFDPCLMYVISILCNTMSFFLYLLYHKCCINVCWEVTVKGLWLSYRLHGYVLSTKVMNWFSYKKKIRRDSPCLAQGLWDTYQLWGSVLAWPIDNPGAPERGRTGTKKDKVREKRRHESFWGLPLGLRFEFTHWYGWLSLDFCC